MRGWLRSPPDPTPDFLKLSGLSSCAAVGPWPLFIPVSAPASEIDPSSEEGPQGSPPGRAACGAAAGSCLWPAGQRVRALLPGPMPGLKPVLWGDLAELGAGDLLGLLEHHRRTGLLVVSCDGVERALALIEGQLVWGRSEQLAENDDAAAVVRGLLTGGVGTFSFLRADEAELPSGDPRELRVVLLDGLRLLDESRRDSRP